MCAMSPSRNIALPFLCGLLVFILVGCETGGSGILIYDYNNDKEISFIPTPQEPGYYREMVVCSNEDQSFFTIQSIADEQGLIIIQSIVDKHGQNIAYSDNRLTEATILRRRDLNGHELSRRYFPFRILFNWDIGLSPDRSMAVCEAYAPDSGNHRSEGKSKRHLWLIRNLDADEFQVDVLPCPNDTRLFSLAFSSIAWLGNEKVFIMTNKDDSLINEIMLVDVNSMTVNLFYELDSLGSEFGLRGNERDRIAFVNKEKQLCVVDEGCTIVAKFDISELLSSVDGRRIEFYFLDMRTICIFRNDEDRTRYIMFNIDTGERQRGEFADRNIRWISSSLYCARRDVVDLSIPHRYCDSLPSGTRLHYIFQQPGGRLVITCDR